MARDADIHPDELLRDLSAVVLEMDPESWSIVYVNGHLADMLGLKPADVLDKPQLWRDQVCLPEDRHLIDDARVAVRRGEVASFVFRAQHRDGHIVWVRSTSRIVDAHGAPRLRATIVDVTAEREAQERFRVLANASHDGVLVHRGGIIIDCNQAFCDQIGYSRDEVGSLAPADWIVHPFADDPATVTGDVDAPVEVLTKSGEVRLMEGRGRDAVFAGERVRLVTMRDITERVRAERAVGRLLEVNEEERSRIAASLHDDTIQVVTAAVMQLDALTRHTRGTISEEDARARNAEIRETLTDAVERARLLTFDLRPQVLEAEGLGAAIRKLADEDAAAHGYEAEVDVAVGRYRDALESLVFRVVRTALLARPEGTRKVRVSLSGDSGRLAGVLEHDGSTDQSAGEEPGLALTAERIRLAGGAFRLASRPGAGTTISFELPAEPL